LTITRLVYLSPMYINKQRLMHWALTGQDYHLDIINKRGGANRLADTL